jgi:hypothetical protein
MNINFSEVSECPVCNAKRYGKAPYNAMKPIEFMCGSYVYENPKGSFHFKQTTECREAGKAK